MALNDAVTGTAAGLNALSQPESPVQDSSPETLQSQLPGMQPTAQTDAIPAYKPYTPPAPIGPAPGSFGSKLANALKGFTAAMGDTGAIGQVPEGAGALYGIQKTMQASAQRQKEEQAHKEVQEQQARENTREDWRMMSNVAHSNAQMRHEQALTYQLGEEQMDKSVAAGSQMADRWSSLPKAQSQTLAENLTASEINNMMKQNGADGKPKLDPTKSTAFPTGKKYVGEDGQGKPQYALTYTVMSIPAEYQLTPSDKSWVDTVNKIPGGQKFNVGDGTNGDRMPGYVANSLFKQAQMINTNTAARDQALGDQKAAQEFVSFKGDGVWGTYLAAAKGNIRQAQEHLMADWNAKTDSGRRLQAQYPGLINDIQRSYSLDEKTDPNGTKGFTEALKQQDTEARVEAQDAETIRHHKETERITEENKKLEQATKNKYIGNPELLDRYDDITDPAQKIAAKQAYRASFPVNEMATIDAIGTGHADVGRMAYLMRSPAGSNVADSVNFFYPDFDNSKVGGYAEAVKSMTAGKDNIRLRSAGIASKHLLQLYQGTTLGALMPGTESYHEKESVYNQLAQELASFNAQSNAPSQTEIADAKDTLGGKFSATWNAKASLRKVASLMTDGISEYKSRYKQAAPSPAYETKYSDLSPEAYASLQLVSNDGKVTIHDSKGRPYTFTEVGPLSQYMQAKMALERQQGAK